MPLSFLLSSFKDILLKRTKGKELHRKILVFSCITLCFLISIFAVYAAGKLDFYYFNPDSVQSNLSLLSRGFNNFFKKAGLQANFQAFAYKQDFDQRIKTCPPDLVLVPSWYFRQHGRSLGMTPLLLSLENGKPSYTKILMVRKSEPYTVEELKGRTVAMTNMGSNAEKLLTETYFKNQGVDFSSMNIIITPKDADALYALVLGQVDAALVGQATLDMVGSVSKPVLEGTRKLAASSPVPAPLLCALPGVGKKLEAARIKDILLNKMDDSHLRDILNINGWQKAY